MEHVEELEQVKQPEREDLQREHSVADDLKYKELHVTQADALVSKHISQPITAQG